MKIAIASGKGGTGKTLVSTNLFHTIKECGIPVTIADCDAEEPNVKGFISGKTIEFEKVIQHVPVIDIKQCTFCEKCQEYCNYNAIMVLPELKYVSVIEELCHDCGACLYACRYGAISEKEKTIGQIETIEVSQNSRLIESRIEIGTYSSVPIIQAAMKKTNGDNLIIYDAPPGTSCPFIATVESADYIVLVTEPTPFGLNDLKLSVETLNKLGKKCGVVINKAGLGNSDTHKYLLKNNIQLLVEIPFDKKIARIYSEGKLITEEEKQYRELFMNLFHTINKKAGIYD